MNPWSDWTTPHLDTEDYIGMVVRGLDEWGLEWVGNGKVATLGEMAYREHRGTNPIVDGSLVLRIVASADYPPFSLIVMHEGLEARIYQRVLLPLLGIAQSIVRRLLWTLVIWDLVDYDALGLLPTWSDFRPLRWVRERIRR